MKSFEEFPNIKILLIDDDPFVRSDFIIAFEKEGLNLETVESAEDALQLLKRNDYEVVISDYDLPGINGLEFFKRVMVNFPGTINILMSPCRDYDVISSTYAMGVDDFLQKPFRLDTLLATIAVHLRKFRRLQCEFGDAEMAAA